MDNVIVYSKLQNSILLVNKKNTDFMGTNKSKEVTAVKINTSNFEIAEPELLQNYFKLNPWEITTDSEDENFKKLLMNNLPEEVIKNKIVNPLMSNSLD